MAIINASLDAVQAGWRWSSDYSYLFLKKMDSYENNQAATKRVCFLLSAFIILLLPWQVDASAADKDAFSIDDYFEVKRITELAFSSEGEWIAYRTVQQSLEHNQAEQKIFIMRMEEGAKPVYVDSIQSGQSFSWIPGTQKLAFLSTNFGTVQVQSLDIKTKKLHSIRIVNSLFLRSNFHQMEKY